MAKSVEDLSVKVEGDFLEIRIRMQKPTQSASGKTMVVATTHGNQAVDAKVNGKQLKLGLNCYYKP